MECCVSKSSNFVAYGEMLIQSSYIDPSSIFRKYSVYPLYTYELLCTTRYGLTLKMKIDDNAISLVAKKIVSPFVINHLFKKMSVAYDTIRLKGQPRLQFSNR